MNRSLYYPLTLILCFIAMADAYAQNMNGWVEMGIQTFQSAQYLTEQKIIVVGGAGQIRVSTDGGETWQANNQNPKIGFQSVSFIDSLHGLIGALSGEIFRTSNGGLTWIQQTSPLTQHLNKILMTSADTAYACGTWGSIFRSVNGGMNWDSLSSGIQYYLRNLYFLTSRLGYAVGDSGAILRTTDAGNSWSILGTDTTFQLLGIDFIDSLHGAVCGQSSAVFSTSDAGKSWHRYSVDINQQSLLTSITFHSIKNLSAISVGGGLFRTKNGGVTWEPIEAPKELQDITFLLSGGFRKQRDKGWGVGYSGVILLSADSGTTWKQSASCPIRDGYIEDMHFFDSSTGYAVGRHNLIMRTLNGGETWKSLAQEDELHFLYGLYSPSQDTCWVYGDYGWLNKTYDGWKTSFQESSPSIPEVKVTNFIRPRSVFMVNRSLGFLVSDTIIWKTTDGGSTWSAKIWRGYFLPGFLERVFFPNENVGFASGFYSVRLDTTSNRSKDHGILLRTKNSGVTWDTLNYGSRIRLYGMYFWNEDEGIVCGDSGIVLKTSDGGDSWRESFRIPGMVPGQSLPSGMNFITTKVGYLTTDPGKIFVTTDGGESWKLDLDFSNAKLFYMQSPSRIVFPDSNTVMISGYQGILKKKIDLTKLSVESTEAKSVDRYLWLTLNQNPIATTLSCKVYYFGLQAKPALRIYDILGREVLDLSENLQPLSTAFGTQIDANISALSNGVYLLVLDAGSMVKSQRFIIAK